MRKRKRKYRLDVLMRKRNPLELPEGNFMDFLGNKPAECFSADTKSKEKITCNKNNKNAVVLV